MLSYIDLPDGYIPRKYQRDVNHAIFVDDKKHVILVWHRRSGKTLNTLNIAVGLCHQRIGLVLHTFPQLTQARKVIWNGADRDGRRYLDYIPNELVKRIRNDDMMIEFKNGSIYQLGGTDRYDSLMGTNPIGIIYDEYSLGNPFARLYLSPILDENDGIEILPYTPRGRNHGHKIYVDNKDNPDWYVSLMGIDKTTKHDGTPVVTPEKIEKRRREGYPEELIQQEYYCSFDASMPGSYYAEYIKKAEDDGRIKDYEIEPKIPVYTFWDLGISDDMAIIFVQPFAGELRVINCYQNNNEGLTHYKEYLDDFKKKHKINYKYHFAPHDINVRELSSGKSRLEIAHSLGIPFYIAPSLTVQDGIEAVRLLFSRFYFHKTNCAKLLNSLRDYRREFDEKNSCFKQRPVHDWTSHASDAMRYFAISWRKNFSSKESDSKGVHTYAT